MSSGDACNPQQLRMFMPVKELHVADDPETGYPPEDSLITPGDWQAGGHGTFKNLWAEKLEDSHRPKGKWVNNPMYDPDATLTDEDYDQWEDASEAEGEYHPHPTAYLHSGPGSELAMDQSLTRSDAKVFYEKEPSLHRQIAAEGVREPIPLMWGADIDAKDKELGMNTIRNRSTDTVYIVDGHHRIAAAHDLNPNAEVPVTYPNQTPTQEWLSKEG
jgi:hypothetical protein